jgi:hypothetical protein
LRSVELLFVFFFEKMIFGRFVRDFEGLLSFGGWLRGCRRGVWVMRWGILSAGGGDLGGEWTADEVM